MEQLAGLPARPRRRQEGDWAYANLGVFVALALSFAVAWFARRGRIRAQEEGGRAAGA